MKHFKQAFNGISNESYGGMNTVYSGNIDMMSLSKDIEMGFESLVNSISQLDIIQKQINHLDSTAEHTSISKESLINTCNICNSIGTSIGMSSESLINIEKLESISFTNKAYSITKEGFKDIISNIAGKISEIIRKIVNWLGDVLKNFGSRHKGLIKKANTLREIYNNKTNNENKGEFQLDLEKYYSRYNILTSGMMSTDSFQNLPKYVSELFNLIKNQQLDKILKLVFDENKVTYEDADQKHLQTFVEFLTATTEDVFIIPQDLKSKTPVLGPNKVVQTEFSKSEKDKIEGFTILDIEQGNKKDVNPVFGTEDIESVNDYLSNIDNNDPSSGIDRIKRYMEHLKIPGSGNDDGNKEEVMRKISIMKKGLKITTLASTFGYELADMYLNIVIDQLKQIESK